MKSREITIYDIAGRLNIAPSTVSRGLKGHHTVSQKTQKKIKALAEEMGYQSNTFAVGLRTKKTNTIGVIIPRLNSDFMAQVIAGIENVTNLAGYNLIFTQSSENRNKEIRNVKTMLANRVDALLVSLSASTQDVSHLDIFFEKQIPVLFFDRVPDSKSMPSVYINNKEAGFAVTNHLISQGARRIVHISDNQAINVYSDRLKGYLRSLQEQGIPFDKDLLIISDLGEESGSEIARKVIELKADAIFAANDLSAASCMNELKRLGVNVPNDILVAGFNNDIISRSVTPPLTTINNPALQMGEIAARHMVDHLSKRIDLNKSRRVIMKSELIIRESTKR